MPALAAPSLRLPSLCALCGAFDRTRLCGDCRARFVYVVPRCTRCAIVVPAGVTACGACVAAPPPQRHAVAAFDYAPPWAALVAHFKFDAALDLAGVFAEALARAVAQSGAGSPDLAVPVPLAPARLAERGFNQAWELARRVARRAGVAADASLLLRVRETPQQAALHADAREANLRGAFAVEPLRRAALAGRTVALVDDVMTTGATARAATRALLDAGAAAVDLWLLARTPAPAAA